ncbi:hypothetical protein QTJ16_002963 [Diplocarpon rosae]|uniref:Uncharacterized protein n=1 Tax=Diplocarpon rosae TaxID=946125 RepID=A0AAD9T3B6_9HELO|nr:hypothetical protein QTJ16_002963 [Diplocarpon rosae]
MSRRSVRPQRTTRNAPVYISESNEYTAPGRGPGSAISIDDSSPRPKKRIRTAPAKLKTYVVSSSDEGGPSDDKNLLAPSPQVGLAVSHAELMRSWVDCGIEMAIKEMAAANSGDNGPIGCDPESDNPLHAARPVAHRAASTLMAPPTPTSDPSSQYVGPCTESPDHNYQSLPLVDGPVGHHQPEQAAIPHPSSCTRQSDQPGTILPQNEYMPRSPRPQIHQVEHDTPPSSALPCLHPTSTADSSALQPSPARPSYTTRTKHNDKILRSPPKAQTSRRPLDSASGNLAASSTAARARAVERSSKDLDYAPPSHCPSTILFNITHAQRIKAVWHHQGPITRQKLKSMTKSQSWGAA